MSRDFDLHSHPPRLGGVFVHSLLAVFGVAALSFPLAAEQTPQELRHQAEQMLGRHLSNQEILDMLRQSGLTPQQIRDRFCPSRR